MFVLIFFSSTLSLGFVNDLRGMEYSLIPAPQRIELTGKKIIFEGGWTIDTKVPANHIAVERLQSGALKLCGIKV